MGEIDDRVKKLLKGHQVVALDTMLFIYSMEARRSYIPFLKSIFYYIERGLTKGVTSIIRYCQVFCVNFLSSNL